MDEFDSAMCSLYTAEYLRRPTCDDLAKIESLHTAKHNIRGMYGSLDCMHVPWKNCPKGWQQSYVGKEGHPTIVLEAVADHNLWFWHSYFGSGGSFNDLNVFDNSNLQQMFIDGTMNSLEAGTGLIPFEIGGEYFNNLFLLVDGIYPLLSRFVRGIKDPITHVDRQFTAWQEGARKDVERAFGVLQSKFHWVKTPIQMHQQEDIVRRMKTVLILHNMSVSDRVMNNNVNVRYDPSFGVQQPHLDEQFNVDIEFEVPSGFGDDASIANARWSCLTSKGEHHRLLNAIKKRFMVYTVDA